MRITPLDVHEQTFRVTFRGFDPTEVDAFLQRVADELERLTEERDQLQLQVEQERVARADLEQTLASARTLQQGLLEQARQEAEILVNQAQLKADRIQARANEELVALRREAQVLSEKRSLWLAELGALAGTLQDWAEHKTRQQFGALELVAGPPQQIQAVEHLIHDADSDEDTASEEQRASAAEALGGLFTAAEPEDPDSPAGDADRG